MRRFWLMGVLAACSGSETTVPVDPGTQEPVVQEPVVKEPTFEDKVTALRGLSVSGDHEEALKQAETLLAEKPEDDGLWRILAREAVAAGSARVLFDRLSAGSPAGGRAEAHHALRSELALSLGLLPEALSAAQAAKSDALIARAVLAGATLPPDPAADPEAAMSPAQALVAVLTATKPVDEATAAAAAGVTGWQAALLRGDHALKAGNVAGALAAYGAAADSGDPRGVLAGNLSRAKLARAGGEGAPSRDEAIGWLTSAAQVAIDDGDGAGLLSAMSALSGLYLSALKPAEGLEALSGLHGSVLEKYGEDAGSLSGLVLARTQLSVGLPLEAFESASRARALLAEQPEAAEAAWVEGWAAHQLGRTEALIAAAAASDGARKQALEALVSLAGGMPPTTEHPFPTIGLSDRDMVYVSMAAARADRSGAIEHLHRAVTAADATGDLALRVHSRLALEEAARIVHHPDAQKTRAALLKLFPTPPVGLAAEVAVRATLDGDLVPVVGDEPVLKVWAALAAGTPAPASATAANLAGLVEWAKGRAGGGASAYNAGLATLPLHRQGMLSLGSVLDGSHGVGLHADLSRLGNDMADLDAAMSCHELGHRRDTYRDDASFGRDFTYGVPEAEREALLAATARARSELLYFQLGAPWPAEAIAAVGTAEAAAAKASPAFSRLMPLAGTSIASLTESQPGTSFLSYLDVNGSMHGIVVTPDGGAHRKVGETSRIYALAQEHISALRSSATVDGFANHNPGNQLREALVDTFSQELTGYGRYQIIAPSELLVFSFTTFPEQASGLRWLADIRTIAQVPTLKVLALPKVPVELYVPDFLGLGTPVEPVEPPKAEAGGEEEGVTPVSVENPDKPKLEIPTDLGLASRHYGSEFRVMLLGEEATPERYLEHAASARYVYIADIDADADGGFKVVGRTMSLSEIRANLIPGKVIFISATAEPEIQVNRARAFLDAGAEAVVVVNWEIADSSMRRFVDGFYEALNRDRPAARALGDARSALLRDAIMGEEAQDPGIWGSIVLYGVP